MLTTGKSRCLILTDKNFVSNSSPAKRGPQNGKDKVDGNEIQCEYTHVGVND